MNNPVLEIKGLNKNFGNVHAVKDVSLSFNPGEIHSIIGENGAGKSTLMNLITGLYLPDSGEIVYNGSPVKFKSPADSLNLGIGIVHQHFMLIDEFTSLENIILGNEIKKGLFLDMDSARSKITDLKEEYGFSFPLDKKVSELTVGEKQQVEILKILFREAEFFIFDEPTAVLTPLEVEGLYKIFNRLKEKNSTIIFISHKLKEIFSISDRISVMRSGEKVSTHSKDSITREEIALEMVGKKVEKIGYSPMIPGEIFFELKQVNLFRNNIHVLNDVNLTLKKGEILGIAGVEGNGQEELVEVLMGITHPNSGEITLNGKNIIQDTVKERITQGFSIIPADRLKVAAISDFSVAENVFLGLHHYNEFSKGIFINISNRDNFTREIISRFNVKADSIDQSFGSLSGGNQQKVIVGKSEFRLPSLLIAHHPTRGLDISATEFVHSIINSFKKDEVGIILISSDLEELLKLSDKILVMYRGTFLREIDRDSISIPEVCKLMAGIKPEIAH
ncbi:MAG: ABC transporter ATP-binding protein [bacterium]|nr:ABC transporter ATP-binding protein [bacterium]